MDAVIINPNTTSDLGKLTKQILSVLPGADIIDSSIGSIDSYFSANSPGNVYLVGGDGSMIFLYNSMLRHGKGEIPITILAGGSGRYWTSNLGIESLTIEQRIELVKKCSHVIDAPLMSFGQGSEFNQIKYFDTLGVGDLGKFYNLLERIKEPLNSSSYPDPLIRRLMIIAAGAIALPAHVFEKEDYTIMFENKPVSGIQMSVIPKILGLDFYSHGKGFALKTSSTTAIPILRLFPYGHGGPEFYEAEFFLQGEVPMHLNGIPFYYDAKHGKEIHVDYVENAIRIVGLKNPFE